MSPAVTRHFDTATELSVSVLLWTLYDSPDIKCVRVAHRGQQSLKCDNEDNGVNRKLISGHK